jgi:exodeoxyribonuclease-3
MDRIKNIFKINKTKNIKIVHWNCNSINNKIEEFKLFLLKYKPDIISLNETKINEITANYLLNSIQNYTFIHKHRNNNKNGGGGVALIINKNIKFVELDIFDHLNLETVAIKIKIQKLEMMIVSYYNPPSSSLAKEIFEIASQSKINFIICGDLNAKTISIGCNQNNTNGSILEEIMNENDCIIANDSTHTYYSFRDKNINYQSDILDLIICSSNLYTKIKDYSVLINEDMTSDHLPIMLSLNSQMLIKTKAPKFVYNFNKADWCKFKQLLPHKAPDHILKDVELLNEYIRDQLLLAAENSIPKKNQNETRKSLPAYILELIKTRKIYRKKYQKEKILEYRTKYNQLTKIIRDEIDSFKNKDWLEFINKQGSNPLNTKPFWQKLNKIRQKRSDASLPTLIKDNNV